MMKIAMPVGVLLLVAGSACSDEVFEEERAHTTQNLGGTPVINAAGIGCDDGQCIWVAGDQLGAMNGDSWVELRVHDCGRDPAEVHTTDIARSPGRLTFHTGIDRRVSATTPLFVVVRRPSGGSTCFLVSETGIARACLSPSDPDPRCVRVW